MINKQEYLRISANQVSSGPWLSIASTPTFVANNIPPILRKIYIYYLSAPTDSATHPDVDGCSDNGEGGGGGSIVFLGMDGPSDNLRSSTAVNMHQRKWKRSVDYIGNWMVAKCPHDMMVESHDVEPAHEVGCLD